MNRNRFPKSLKFFLIGITAALTVAACLVSGLALDSMYLQHKRAASRWVQREPHHYTYTIHIHSSFWRSSLQIDILEKKIIQSTDLINTGLSAD